MADQVLGVAGAMYGVWRIAGITAVWAAALAAHGGEVTVRGADELRVKESDRIAALVAGFRALGIAYRIDHRHRSLAEPL